jgi:hypothetical protein
MFFPFRRVGDNLDVRFGHPGDGEGFGDREVEVDIEEGTVDP